MDDELNFVAKYVPKLFFNDNEPFLPKAISYYVYKKGADEKSKSSNYKLRFDEKSIIAIEFAIYYTYDIQHLYDLEHVFVYLNDSYEVEKVISSFHGKFYNSLINNDNIFYTKERVKLFVQPGKHALMPTPYLFNLFEAFNSSCNTESGVDGFLINDYLSPYFKKDIEFDELLHRYINKKYSFFVSSNYNLEISEEKILIPFSQLFKFIQRDLTYEINIISKALDK